MILALLAAERWRQKIKIFNQKNIKIWKFWMYKSYIPQKKAKNMWNTNSKRNSMIFCKGTIAFFTFFLVFSPTILWFISFYVDYHISIASLVSYLWYEWVKWTWRHAALSLSSINKKGCPSRESFPGPLDWEASVLPLT